MISYSKLSKNKKLALWGGTVLFFIIIMVLIFVLVVSLIVSPNKDSGKITYKFGTGSKRDSVSEVSRTLYYPDGVAYFDFSSLAEACDFSVSGDEGEVRYIIGEERDTVKFYYNERLAIVNGDAVMLPRRAVMQGGRLYIPCEFIKRYMTGVNVSVTNSSITVTYDLDKVAILSDAEPIEKPSV